MFTNWVLDFIREVNLGRNNKNHVYRIRIKLAKDDFINVTRRAKSPDQAAKGVKSKGRIISVIKLRRA